MLSRVFAMYSWYDRVVSVSQATSLVNQEYFSSAWAVPKEKFSYADNLLDPDRVIRKAGEPLPEGAEDRFSGGPVFLTMGRLSREKDHAKLLRAFARVSAAYPSARLLILGGGYLYADLLNLVKDLKLERSVYMPGFIANPYPWLKRADCFVLSSNHEGQPMVLLEAMALNKPIISTDISSTRGMLAGTAAMLVDNNEQALAAGLLKCCEALPKPVDMDFDAYNANCVQQFYRNIGLQ